MENITVKQRQRLHEQEPHEHALVSAIFFLHQAMDSEKRML